MMIMVLSMPLTQQVQKQHTKAASPLQVSNSDPMLDLYCNGR